MFAGIDIPSFAVGVVISIIVQAVIFWYICHHTLR